MIFLNLKKTIQLSLLFFKNTTFINFIKVNYTNLQFLRMKLNFTQCLSIVLLFIGIFSTSSILAQSSEKLTRIRGVVIDKETKEPLPFVAVAFPGTSIGTTTDFDGKYELSTQWATESLEISFIGYTSSVVSVTLGEKQVIDIELESEAITLDADIVVKAKKKRYRKKNNPAVDLMRKVIAQKDENSLSRYDHYEFDKYEKVELDIFR